LVLWIIVLFGALISEIDGHARFGYPQARSSDTGIKGPYPCGNFAFWGDGQPTSVLQPGKLNVSIGETVNHIGAPFRIALSIGSDDYYDRFVLLDHIPHNDAGSPSFEDPKPYMMEIEIPDIHCPRCSLQVLSIMTDKLVTRGLECCSYPNSVVPGDTVCFSVYHSCANVDIRGKIPVIDYHHEYKGPCGPYNLNRATWNYLPNIPTWIIADPNYAPNLQNNCTGWNRTCDIISAAVTEPIEDTNTDVLNNKVDSDSTSDDLVGPIVAGIAIVVIIAAIVFYVAFSRGSIPNTNAGALRI